MIAYYSKRKDTSPVTDTLLQSDGSAVNLTGSTIRFYVLDRLANVIVNGGTVTGFNGGALDTSGRVQYLPQAADVANAGTFFAEWEVTFSGNVVQTWPNGEQAYWFITPDLA